MQREDGFYDVQTEDRGLAHPFVDTVVLLSGQVLHRRSVSYTDLLVNGAIDPAILRERVERQHFDVLESLRSGSLALQPAASRGNAAIQVRLLNSTTWLLNGKVTLDIHVRTRGSGHVVAGADVEAFIEGTAGAPVRFKGKSDAGGRVRLEFAFPLLAQPSNAALVISANVDRVHDQLRYHLRPTPPTQAPPSQ